MTLPPDLPVPWHCPKTLRRATLPYGTAPRQEAVLITDDRWEVLLARANDGDEAAFLRFLTEVTPPLRGLIRARGRGLPPDLHEDILQEVLLAIHLKRQSWRRDTPVRPWLYAVARHKVVDAFRRHGCRVELPLEDVADILAAEAGPAPMAARDADRMLGMIDARSAALVRAVRLEDQTTEDAAARLGLSAGAARVVLHRALRRLSELAERMK